MPCSTCGQLLCVDDDGRTLFCPECSTYAFEEESILEDKIREQRELLTHGNIISMIKEYSRLNLLVSLMWKLNLTAHELYQSRRMKFREFAYLNILIKHIYQEDGFGDKQLEDVSDLPEDIDLAIESYSQIRKSLDFVEDGFRFCMIKFVKGPNATSFFGEYLFFDSEYMLCFDRCAKSIFGATEENIDLFDTVSDEFRDFTDLGTDDIESPEDFAEVFYEFIMSMKFMAAADDIIGEIYTTHLPNEVTVNDITDFLSLIDSRLTEQQHQYMDEFPLAVATDEREIDACGETVFGDDWQDVKDKVIVDQSHLEAHPFLFRIQDTIKRKLPGFRKAMDFPVKRVIYPKFFAKLLRFQIFPLLKNGDQPDGHTILSELTSKNGEKFERNIFEYLRGNGYECYHGAEINRRNPNEIDIMLVLDDALYFIEVKQIMPRLSMYSSEGIEELNEVFDFKIFKEDTGGYNQEPEGKPFPDKVERWGELEEGDSFTSQSESEEEERVENEFKFDWDNLECKMLVVSNLVPSYIEKQGVRFLTDIEFLSLIEEEGDVLYEVLD